MKWMSLCERSSMTHVGESVHVIVLGSKHDTWSVRLLAPLYKPRTSESISPISCARACTVASEVSTEAQFFCWLQIIHPNPSVSFGFQQFLETPPLRLRSRDGTLVGTWRKAFGIVYLVEKYITVKHTVITFTLMSSSDEADEHKLLGKLCIWARDPPGAPNAPKRCEFKI